MTEENTSESKKCYLLFRPFMRLWYEAVRAYTNISSVRWLLLGIVAGIMSGTGAILFFLGVEGLKFLWQHSLAGLTLPAPAGEELFHGTSSSQVRIWVIPILTTLVGLFTGFLIKRYIPESVHTGTDGTDAMIKSFHQDNGKIRPLVAFIRSTTSILTISSGGSAGREGPISLMGAGLGSWMANKIGLSTKERRILLLAGAAGGLGAIFRAPLGGALTAVEVLYREDFEAEAILPSVISSVVAYTLFTLAYGTEPIFGIPRFSFENPMELPFYILLSLVCALSGWFYIRTFRFIKYSLFNPLNERIGLILTTGLGGLVMGLIGMIFPKLLSGGYGWLELAILGKISIFAMLGILIGKTIATSVTLGSGMSGGMFAPALFVGGMSGGIVGFLAHDYYPHIVTQPGGYVLVGMASFFAGVANAPIGPLIMVCELTQGYGLLAPLMLCSAICLVINRKVSLYENQVDNKFESPAHIDDATINVLENLHVSDFYQEGIVITLEESSSFKAMTDIITNTNQFYFPVRDENEMITGMVAVQDLRRVLFEDTLRDLLVAKDVAHRAVLLSPDDDLYTALLKFVDSDFGQLPVVDPDNTTMILGLLSREDVFKAYTETIKEIKGE